MSTYHNFYQYAMYYYKHTMNNTNNNIDIPLSTEKVYNYMNIVDV